MDTRLSQLGAHYNIKLKAKNENFFSNVDLQQAHAQVISTMKVFIKIHQEQHECPLEHYRQTLKELLADGQYYRQMAIWERIGRGAVIRYIDLELPEFELSPRQEVHNSDATFIYFKQTINRQRVKIPRYYLIFIEINSPLAILPKKLMKRNRGSA